jgi:hypothetical protein|tara:strand:- start:42 stop:200 length:159 start_codon:yes stop_codon:yes gene_type:complete
MISMQGFKDDEDAKLFKHKFLKAKIENLSAFEFKGNFYLTAFAKDFIICNIK